jgi:hypothetical protein
VNSLLSAPGRFSFGSDTPITRRHATVLTHYWLAVLMLGFGNAPERYGAMPGTHLPLPILVR